MKTSSYSHWRLAAALLLVPITVAVAQSTAAGLPAALTGLMPSGATSITGNWNVAGTLSMGDARAEMAGAATTCDGTPGRGDISLKVMRQTRQGPSLQLYEQAWRQKGVEAKAAMERDAAQRQQEPLKVSLSPVREQSVPGGTLAFFDFTQGCVQASRPTRTTAFLKGVVQLGGVFVEIGIVMPGTGEQARAIATEILTNVKKADFGESSGK